MKNYSKALFILMALSLFLHGLTANEQEIELIKKYYQLLRSRSSLKEAYEISTKKVSFNTFQGWYSDVVMAHPINIKKIAQNSYSFKVFMSWYDPEGIEDDTVSVFQVEMQVGQGRIVSSKSKSLQYYVEQEIPYKERLVIEIADNVKKMQKEISLLNKESGKKQLLETHSYDRFGVNFRNIEIIGDILVLPFNSFDFAAVYAFDLTTSKKLDFDGVHIAISPGGDFIFSYSDIPAVVGTPLTLEYYKGKPVRKVIIREGEVTGVTFFRLNGRLKLKVNGNPEGRVSSDRPAEFKDGQIFDAEDLLAK